MKYYYMYTGGQCQHQYPSFVGSTYLDDHNETALTIFHWKEAHKIRTKHCGYIGIVLCLPLCFWCICITIFFTAKEPAVPLRSAYGNVAEFTTLTELDSISTDVDAMRIQSLVVCERILGIQHTDTLFRLMFR